MAGRGFREPTAGGRVWLYYKGFRRVLEKNAS